MVNNAPPASAEPGATPPVSGLEKAIAQAAAQKLGMDDNPDDFAVWLASFSA